jgi:hypothetical protein
MMITLSPPSKSALFLNWYLLVMVLSVVADVVEIDNSAVHEPAGIFSLPNMVMRRFLQDKRKIYDESYPLYENTLTLSTTTPWNEDRFQDCADDNYTYATNPDNFTWYGLRIIPPEDAGEMDSFHFNSVASMVQGSGFEQPYGEDTPTVVFNSSFLTTERNPTIRLSINDGALFGTYQFFFDDVQDGEPVETIMSFAAIFCLNEPSEFGGEVWMGVVDAILTLSMSQTQLREGASASVALQSLSVTILAIIMLIMIL